MKVELSLSMLITPMDQIIYSFTRLKKREKKKKTVIQSGKTIQELWYRKEKYKIMKKK